MLKEIKSGILTGITIVVTISICGFVYAAISYSALGGKSSGDILSAGVWNKLYEHTVPVGAIMAFDLDTCPTGWSEYTPAYGRFLRGIDKSGTSIDPDGLRTKGSLQADELKSHNHNLKTRIGVSGHAAGAYPSSANEGTIVNQGITAIEANFGYETRPKNVAVLYCKKD